MLRYSKRLITDFFIAGVREPADNLSLSIGSNSEKLILKLSSSTADWIFEISEVLVLSGVLTNFLLSSIRLSRIWFNCSEKRGGLSSVTGSLISLSEVLQFYL